MADILKSAQTQIDDAAGQIGATPTPSIPPPPVPKAQDSNHSEKLPLLASPEETLLPSAASSLTSPGESETILKDLHLPFSSHAESHMTEEKPTETDNAPGEPLPAPVIHPAIHKKRGNKFLLLAVLLFLFATIPLAVFFVSQQGQLADLRGKAQVPGPYPGQPCSPPNAIQCFADQKKHWCDPATNTWSTGGDSCIGTNKCVISDYFCDGIQCTARNAMLNNGTCGNVPSTSTNCNPRCNGEVTNQCQNGEQNRDQGKVLVCTCSQGCSYKKDDTEGSGGSGWVCDENCNVYDNDKIPSLGSCYQIDFVHQGTNQYCGVKTIQCDGSCQTGATDPTPTPGETNPTPTPTPPLESTPTPTPIPGGTCEVIKVYSVEDTDITQEIKDGTKKLALGEQIILATSIGSATKARFRIQGIADWTENNPDETTETEYRLSITIPTTLTQAQGTFEVEVFVDDQWK